MKFLVKCLSCFGLSINKILSYVVMVQKIHKAWCLRILINYMIPVQALQNAAVCLGNVFTFGGEI